MVNLSGLYGDFSAAIFFSHSAKRVVEIIYVVFFPTF